jgi:hypothetical protein
VSILFVLVLGFILLLACAGFAALDAILQGEKIAIPLVAWIGMAL